VARAHRSRHSARTSRGRSDGLRTPPGGRERKTRAPGPGLPDPNGEAERRCGRVTRATRAPMATSTAACSSGGSALPVGPLHSRAEGDHCLQRRVCAVLPDDDRSGRLVSRHRRSRDRGEFPRSRRYPPRTGGCGVRPSAPGCVLRERRQALPAPRADSLPRVQPPFRANPGRVLFLRHNALLCRLDQNNRPPALPPPRKHGVMTSSRAAHGRGPWEAEAGAGQPARLKLRLSRRKWAG
jgi:hypothetical protein